MKAECSTKTKQKIITFSEKRSTLILKNTNKVYATCVRVDGCEITTGIRCDHLMLAKEIEHFIELKGQDLPHAIDQLIASMRVLSSDIKRQTKIAYIICTRSPLNSTAIQNLQVQFRKHYNSQLVIKSSPYQAAF
jgi:hypothetical protein